MSSENFDEITCYLEIEKVDLFVSFDCQISIIGKLGK